jgi:large subunit ribosomal protein L18
MSNDKIKKTKIKSTEDRKRLSVFRSSLHIYAQVIDDITGKTLVSSSSLKYDKGSNIDAAKQVGLAIAKLSKDNGISKVIFDRGPYIYKGRVKALADSAREGGLIF